MVTVRVSCGWVWCESYCLYACVSVTLPLCNFANRIEPRFFVFSGGQLFSAEWGQDPPMEKPPRYNMHGLFDLEKTFIGLVRPSVVTMLQF